MKHALISCHVREEHGQSACLANNIINNVIIEHSMPYPETCDVFVQGTFVFGAVCVLYN